MVASTLGFFFKPFGRVVGKSSSQNRDIHNNTYLLIKLSIYSANTCLFSGLYIPLASCGDALTSKQYHELLSLSSTQSTPATLRLIRTAALILCCLTLNGNEL